MSFRILATSDTHFNFDPKKVGGGNWFPEHDVFIHAGDLMYHGTESEWMGRVCSLAVVDSPLKIYVPGNHDLFVQHYTGPANQDLQRIAKTRLLGTHPKYMVRGLPNGMRVLGLPQVTDLPGWAFNNSEEELDRFIDLFIADVGKIDIVVSHSPPAGILDGSHYGVKAWLRLQMMLKPEIWICGHVHEEYGTKCHNGTTFYNVSMLNRDYKVANPPVLIEI